MLDRDRDRRRRWFLIFGGLLLLAVGTLLGRTVLQPADWRDKARTAEAARAEAEGLLVAEQSTTAELRTLATALRDQVADLEARLGVEVELRVVYRTRTNPINVEMERLLGDRRRQIRELNEKIRRLNAQTGSNCPECPTFDDLLPGREAFAFEVESVTASLESRAGNRFLVGEAELFLTAPRALAGSLGSATYRADVSEFFDSGPSRSDERWYQRWYAGLQYALVRENSLNSFDQSHYRSVVVREAPDRFRVYGGVRLFPLKRRTWQAGIWADSRAAGVDLGISF